MKTESKDVYVPREGDIVECYDYLGVVEDLLPEGHFNVRDLCDLAEEKRDEFTADDRPSTLRLGRTEEAIKLRDQEIAKAFKKRVEAQGWPFEGYSDQVIKGLIEILDEVFAEVDK